MGRVGMVLDLVAEFVMGQFVMGRVCYGPRCSGMHRGQGPKKKKKKNAARQGLKYRTFP